MEFLIMTSEDACPTGNVVMTTGENCRRFISGAIGPDMRWTLLLMRVKRLFRLR